MEIRVHVVQHLPEQSGVSKQGNAWSKKAFVAETYDAYSKKICFTIFNNKCDMPELNSDILVGFDLSSNSWVDKNGNERWSTDALAYSIKPGAEATQPTQFQQPQVQDNTIQQPVVPQGPGYQPAAPVPTNDLPF